MQGYTLVELMIAVCVGLLALAGATSGLLHVCEVWQARDLQARLHERIQYVFATLEPELQMAGFLGTGTTPAFDASMTLPAGAVRCGRELLTRLDLPVEVREGPWPLGCAALGGGALPGNPVLITRRASAQPATAANGRIQLLGAPGQPALSRVLWDAPPVLPDGASLRDLQLRAWYIARAADGDAATPALRMKNLTAIAGEPAFIDTEVMPGVAALQATLLPAPAAPRRVRLTLAVQADAYEARAGARAPQLTVTREFALRNAPAALTGPP